MKALTVSCRKVLKEELEALTIEDRQFQKETLAGEWFYRAVHIPMFPLILSPQQRLHAARGDAVTQDREQATAALILSPQANPLVTVLARALPPS